MRLDHIGVVVGIALLTARPVQAVPMVQINASGTWGPGAPVTALSAAGLTWSISFQESNPLAADPGRVTTMGWATDTIYSLTYTLGGAVVPLSFSQALFYTAGNGGGFDINFDAAGVFDTFSVYSASPTAYAYEFNGAFTSTSFGESVRVGAIEAAGTPSGDGPPTGDGVLTIFPASAAAVPEPATWALMLLGFGRVGIALRRRAVVATA
jgi:hypothetical protein